MIGLKSGKAEASRERKGLDKRRLALHRANGRLVPRRQLMFDPKAFMRAQDPPQPTPMQGRKAL